MTTAITVSERAARRIGEILKVEGDGAMLRISVEGGGCSGFQYKFDVDHDKAEDDLVIAREGAVVLVDPASVRSEEHTSELQSQSNLVCRPLLERKDHQRSTGVRGTRHRSGSSH